MAAVASTVLALASMPPTEADALLAEMSEGDLIALAYDWHGEFARPKQFPPGHPQHECPGCATRGNDPDWFVWLMNMGRGAGKTRPGAETIRDWERQGYRRFALVGETAADCRDVMVEGESGILSVYPPSERPLYEPSKRRITWKSGAMATLFSGEKPDQLRGPQFDKAWVDELAKYKYPQDTWDNLMFGLRLGDNPQAVVTTTPRPIPIIKTLLADASCHVTTGSTYENADNLAPQFLALIREKYEGTRLGRQELEAEILEDVEGALWTLVAIDALRVRSAPELRRIVVSVDPSVNETGDRDECGIVVAGIGPCSCRGQEEMHGFVLEDLSDHLSPNAWAQRAVAAYRTQKADRIIAEKNNGGALVEVNVRTVDANVPYEAVHASVGKRTRAEPVSALYEQGKVHHVGQHAKLEDEMCSWVPLTGQPSPGRMDALVWAISKLMLGETRHPLYTR